MTLGSGVMIQINFAHSSAGKESAYASELLQAAVSTL